MADEVWLTGKKLASTEHCRDVRFGPTLVDVLICSDVQFVFMKPHSFDGSWPVAIYIDRHRKAQKIRET